MVLGGPQLFNVLKNGSALVQDLMDDPVLRFCKLLEGGAESQSERLES
jgi:hypothetical protein